MDYVYECGERMGECTCYDCAVPDCDNFKERLSDTCCPDHSNAPITAN